MPDSYEASGEGKGRPDRFSVFSLHNKAKRERPVFSPQVCSIILELAKFPDMLAAEQYSVFALNGRKTLSLCTANLTFWGSIACHPTPAD